MRPPRQTGLYVDYVEKAGLVDYCTVQQDDDLLGPREWYKIWTCDMYALVLLLVAEILQRLVPHAVFQCILGDGRFESSTVAMVPSTRAGLNRKPQIHFKLTHSQHVRVVVVTARALANWAMIYPTSHSRRVLCLEVQELHRFIWFDVFYSEMSLTDMYDDISFRYLMISQSCPSSYVG